MNEKFKKIIYIIVVSLLLAFSIFSTVEWTRTNFQLHTTRNTMEQCNTELGQLRAELDNATDQQSALTDGINRCTELTNRTGEILSSSIDTVEELRTTLLEIRKNEEDLAQELYRLRRIIYGNTDNNDSAN